MPQPSLSDKNWDILRQYRPELARLLEETPDLPAIGLAATQSGEPEIFLHFQGGTQKPYHGGSSPLAYAKDLIGRLDLKNPRLLIFLGFGLGHHVLEYAHNPHPLNEGLLILEPHPQVLKKALEATDLTPLLKSPAVHFFVGSNPVALDLFLNQFFAQGPWLTFANAIEYIPLPPAQEISPAFFQEAQKLLPQVIGHQFNRLFGDPFDGLLGTRNVMSNLPRMLVMPSIDQAGGVFAKKPGILIASGPSLEQALPLLREVGDHAVMAACPSALPALLEAGVHPHIWLNIERLEEQGRFFENVKQKPKHIFVAPPLVHPRCFEGNGGLNAYILGASLQQTSWLPLEGTVHDLGHSSAHAAFLILETLGCDPIYLIGQDLSYSRIEGASSHAAGVWNESERMMMNIKEANQKIFELEGNDSKPVKANLFWLTYLQTFANRLIPEHQGTVFNVICEHQGAKIPGTIRIDPSELPGRLTNPPFEIFPLLEKRLVPRPEEIQNQKKQIILDKMDKAIVALERLIQDSRAFGLHCKEFQFSQEVVTKRWEKAEATYRDFLQSVQKYSIRIAKDPNYADDRDTYQGFFHPIIQGMLLRYQIEFFTSGDDLRGDFSEITRKTEILFHMSKDEGYWAAVARDLLQRTVKNL